MNNNQVGYIGYQLRELMKENLIGSIFTDPNNPDDYIAGMVHSVSARTALIAAITPYGQADGYLALKLTAVLEVQHDSVYAERLALLMRLNNTRIQRLDAPPDDDALVQLLGYAARTNAAVTLWTATESYAGFATQVNDLYLTIMPVDFMGDRCQEMTFRLTDIEMVSIGSEEERMYELLDNHHNMQGGR